MLKTRHIGCDGLWLLKLADHSAQKEIRLPSFRPWNPGGVRHSRIVFALVVRTFSPRHIVSSLQKNSFCALQ
jgi:hypothetical protein